MIITTAKDLDVRGKYTVEVKGFGSQDAIAGSVVRTDAFDKKYAYDGRRSGRHLHEREDRIQGVGSNRHQG